MTTKEHRINEFTRRQIYYRNNYVTKLTTIKGKWNYATFGWTNTSSVPVLVDSGKYNGEDPYSLIDIAEKIFGAHKAGAFIVKVDIVKGQAKKGIKKPLANQVQGGLTN